MVPISLHDADFNGERLRGFGRGRFTSHLILLMCCVLLFVPGHPKPWFSQNLQATQQLGRRTNFLSVPPNDSVKRSHEFWRECRWRRVKEVFPLNAKVRAKLLQHRRHFLKLTIQESTDPRHVHLRPLCELGGRGRSGRTLQSLNKFRDVYLLMGHCKFAKINLQIYTDVVYTFSVQRVHTVLNGEVREFCLPGPGEEVMPGVTWGAFDEFFTPAFWKARLWIDGDDSPMMEYAIGRSLREEVAACLLGGFGMPAEIGLAAFERVRDRHLLNGAAPAFLIEDALREPLTVAGRRVKYRYPVVKSRFVSTAMERLNREQMPSNSPRAVRDWLVTFPGIGPKTASWITRNFLHTDDVAILDVHVIRAGVLMGLFSPANKIPRDYFSMEARLLAFARGLGVQLSKFDSVLWCYMRRMNGLAIQALNGNVMAGNLA